MMREIWDREIKFKDRTGAEVRTSVLIPVEPLGTAYDIAKAEWLQLALQKAYLMGRDERYLELDAKVRAFAEDF